MMTFPKCLRLVSPILVEKNNLLILFSDYDYGPKSESDSRKAPSEPYKFEEYCRRGLPHLVRRQLEIIAEKESRQIEERLKRQIVQIVRSCYELLVLLFQQENHPAAIKPPRFPNLGKQCE